MYVHVPALRGKMGTRTYYACLMPLEAILNMFKFDPEERQWTDLSPEQREQRALNKSCVPALTSYILDNEDDYLFASITASYKTEPVFVPSPQPDGSENIGTIKLKMGDELTINDGQHRCAGIVEAVKKILSSVVKRSRCFFSLGKARRGCSRCSRTSTVTS